MVNKQPKMDKDVAECLCPPDQAKVGTQVWKVQ